MATILELAERAARSDEGLRWLRLQLGLQLRMAEGGKEERALRFAVAYAEAANEGETDEERTSLVVEYTKDSHSW